MMIETDKTFGSAWTEEEYQRLYTLRKLGMGPAQMHREGYFPGRNWGSIKEKLCQIYRVHPELKDRSKVRKVEGSDDTERAYNLTSYEPTEEDLAAMGLERRL
jgi:hypothetical protein